MDPTNEMEINFEDIYDPAGPLHAHLPTSRSTSVMGISNQLNADISDEYSPVVDNLKVFSNKREYIPTPKYHLTDRGTLKLIPIDVQRFNESKSGRYSHKFGMNPNDPRCCVILSRKRRFTEDGDMSSVYGTNFKRKHEIQQPNNFDSDMLIPNSSNIDTIKSKSAEFKDTSLSEFVLTDHEDVVSQTKNSHIVPIQDHSDQKLSSNILSSKDITKLDAQSTDDLCNWFKINKHKFNLSNITAVTSKSEVSEAVHAPSSVANQNSYNTGLFGESSDTSSHDEKHAASCNQNTNESNQSNPVQAQQYDANNYSNWSLPYSQGEDKLESSNAPSTVTGDMSGVQLNNTSEPFVRPSTSRVDYLTYGSEAQNNSNMSQVDNESVSENSYELVKHIKVPCSLWTVEMQQKYHEKEEWNYKSHRHKKKCFNPCHSFCVTEQFKNARREFKSLMHQRKITLLEKYSKEELSKMVEAEKQQEKFKYRFRVKN